MENLNVSRTLSDKWSPPHDIQSSMVINATDTKKQDSIAWILKFFQNQKNITIEDEDVYFFDDRADNVEPFKQTKYNAQQISCTSRDESMQWMKGVVGKCGGRLSEVSQQT